MARAGRRAPFSGLAPRRRPATSIRRVSHTPKGWDLILAHLLDELGVPPEERGDPSWEHHRRIPESLHRNERLIELAECVEGSRRGAGAGLLLATSRRLVFVPFEEERESRAWPLRAIAEARLERGLLATGRALAVVVDGLGRRFRDLRPVSRAPHLMAVAAHEVVPAREDGAWPGSPPIAAIGELVVHLDRIVLPGGAWAPIDGSVSAHLDAGGESPGARGGSGGEVVAALRLEGRDWTWGTPLPAAWLEQGRLVADAVDAAAALTPGARGPARDPVVDRLERLARLREQGILDEDEAAAQKARILADGERPPDSLSV